MHNVVSREHFELARRFRAIYSKYEKGRDLVQIGAYVHGSDPALDEAIALHDDMARFLQQDMFESAPMAQVLPHMAQACNAVPAR
jgi:flagellum-specific ATP synthase